MYFDEHENNRKLASAIYKFIGGNCNFVCDSNKDSVNNILIFLFNKFNGMSENEILETFERNGGLPREFHDTCYITSAINDKLGVNIVTESQVEESCIKDITGVKSFTVRDYCIRVNDSFVLVHDYGVSEDIDISIT